MKLGWRLGQWATSGRTAIVVFLPVLVALLAGCWAVAGPLIGAGAVGAGAIAVAKRPPEARPSVSLEGQRGDGRNEALGPSDERPADHGSGPAMVALPPALPPETLSPTIATAESPHKERRRHTRRSRTRAIAHSRKQPLPSRPSSSATAAVPASTSHGDLLATTIVH